MCSPGMAFAERDPMGNPHDSLFKQALGQPERAAAFLGRFLPPRVVESLALDELTVVVGSFVDEALESRHTDLLLEVPRRGEPDGSVPMLVYVLLEHQSSVDPWMARRLLRYIDRIWSRWEVEHPLLRELPVVVPMVLYHGARGWSGSRELHGLVGWGQASSLEGALARHVPGFSFLRVDLARTDDRTLGEDGVALTLKVMKYIRARDFERRLEQLAADLGAALREPAGLQLLVGVVHYVLEVRDTLDRDRLARIIETTTGPEIGAKVMSVADQLREEGRREGLRQGRQEGRQEGRRAELQLLTRLLTSRFGALDGRALELLERSTAAKRLAWGERLLGAAALHEVFGSDWER